MIVGDGNGAVGFLSWDGSGHNLSVEGGEVGLAVSLVRLALETSATSLVARLSGLQRVVLRRRADCERLDNGAVGELEVATLESAADAASLGVAATPWYTSCLAVTRTAAELNH